jgi:branched-chain amino acid transport system ATP-binding protein
MLELTDVTFSYGKVAALKKVSLEVGEKEAVCLIGGNGAGKTTTLNVICGLLPALSGKIVFMGKRIERLPPHEIVKRGICLVPEGRKVFPKMTVLENLKLGGYVHGDHRRINRNISRMYDHFPILAERKRQPADKLSGGEQQMLAIARGLMAEPNLILLDEPSLGLSPLMVQRVAQIIGEIGHMGVTVFLVEQKLYALKVVDRGYVLENGTVSYAESAERLFANPAVRKAYLGL